MLHIKFDLDWLRSSLEEDPNVRGRTLTRNKETHVTLKCKFHVSIYFYLAIRHYSFGFVWFNTDGIFYFSSMSAEFPMTICFNGDGIICHRWQLLSNFKAYIVAPIALRKVSMSAYIGRRRKYVMGRQYISLKGCRYMALNTVYSINTFASCSFYCSVKKWKKYG